MPNAEELGPATVAGINRSSPIYQSLRSRSRLPTSMPQVFRRACPGSGTQLAATNSFAPSPLFPTESSEAIRWETEDVKWQLNVATTCRSEPGQAQRKRCELKRYSPLGESGLAVSKVSAIGRSRLATNSDYLLHNTLLRNCKFLPACARCCCWRIVKLR